MQARTVKHKGILDSKRRAHLIGNVIARMMNKDEDKDTVAIIKFDKHEFII